ncbi:MobA/MobL family protein [Oricola sp.]|uniref:MobA/MobL family protein n=1 Tax=Oricola sp. TaxID=1979950 RepID=UPI0025E45272|nr:MobA/MobL family protein [Oricola sp.]MCI5076436.1 MobA/MobL family protein [Oricola sp.]
MQDGNIHCHIDNLSRRGGKHGERIAVAKAAYNAGQRLWSEAEKRFVDFDHRVDVVCSRLLLPDGAPAWAGDRVALWNKVDLSAKRRDARLAKTIDAAITRDIPVEQRATLLEEFAAPLVAMGCVADIAIHEDGTDHNPHIHILLTTRELIADGFGAKLAALEHRQFVKNVRKAWADISNRYLAKAGSTVRVDHRSYKARGIEAEPTVHRGPNPMERRQKREHARRVSEEREMAKPDAHDRRHYPLLTSRETWPPEPVASPDLTTQERDEHQRYWDEQKIQRLEEEAQAEPDHLLEPAPAVPWYQDALQRARTETRDEGPAPELEPNAYLAAYQSRQPNEDHDRAQAQYDASVLERAKAMMRNRHEHEALQAMRDAPPEARRFVEDFILQERMQAIRERDRAEKLRRMRPDVREKLEALRPEYRDWERDLPVPGPNGEALHPRELDLVQERMLEEHLREEDEPDRREPER